MATTANTTGTGKVRNDWDERELGCLWRREKQGTKEKYLTGVLDADKLRKILTANNGDVQIVCFSNKGKTKDTHPDLRIYLSEKKPAAKSGGKTSAAAPAPVPTPDANELI